MATKTYTFTEEEARAIAILINNEEHDANGRRERAPWPGSPMEKAAEADQLFWQQIQAKLSGRDSVPSGR